MYCDELLFVIGVRELVMCTAQEVSITVYWHYRQHRDVALLQQIFGHLSPSVTLRYIGIDDDVVDKSLEDFYI